MIQIKIKNESKNPLPEYATTDAAGMDLRANNEEPIELKPLQRAAVPTGLFLEIPQGYEGQVRPRSGLAFKHGVSVINSPGTIDADYRGEVKVLLVNLSDQSFTINPGERIAQIVFSAYAKAELIESSQLAETQRGQGGFGHTGLK